MWQVHDYCRKQNQDCCKTCLIYFIKFNVYIPTNPENVCNEVLMKSILRVLSGAVHHLNADFCTCRPSRVTKARPARLVLLSRQSLLQGRQWMIHSPTGDHTVMWNTVLQSQNALRDPRTVAASIMKRETNHSSAILSDCFWDS